MVSNTKIIANKISSQSKEIFKIYDTLPKYIKMKAEIINIGTELVIGHTVNTNAVYISELLNSIGISVHFHTSVGDNPERIKECLDYAVKRSDLVVLTGGLGPTDDDISHDVLAEFCGLSLEEDAEQKQILEKRFHQSGYQQIPEINYRQARVIAGAEVIANPIGTAIGMYLKHCKQIFISFPGVPCEMEAMLELVSPKLIEVMKAADKYGSIVSRKIKLTNITESQMAQTIIDHYQQLGKPNPFLASNPSLAPYADLGEVYLRITASAASEQEARALMQGCEEDLHQLFPKEIFGYDHDSLQSVLAEKLLDKHLTIAFAESCTGGLASKLITDVAGASKYTGLNLVTYSNQSKQQLLQVQSETLEKYGAVSNQCALEMAQGLARISGADINVSITGIAGPDGASKEKPIGTIYACILINNELRYCDKLAWRNRPLSREQVRELACKKVFWLLLQNI